MFLVLLRYKVPLEEVDANMKAHVTYLKKWYARGVFVVSGRRVPRTGGVILAKANSEDELRGILAEDPFVTEGVADFELIEFRTSMHARAFAPFADSGTRPV
jgi:uncharacterized protein YciI